MKRTAIYFLLLLITCLTSKAQTFTDSNLPIFIITTDEGADIPDEPGVFGNLKIIYRGEGQRNYLSDQNNELYLNYNGRIDIEIRGSSSQDSPKKSYGFETIMNDDVTNNNVSLLGMPEENDWILGGMVFDTAMIRDYLCYNLSRKLGNYASRTAYCEVIINNDYKGLYLLQEKIKADDGRVDVIKIKTDDNTQPDVTGGYITKADKYSSESEIAWKMYSFQGSEVDYIHVLPKPENVTTTQTNYIKKVFTDLESAALNGNTSLSNGYPSIIDIPSFIDFMIINEFASNPDAYQYSTYFHKDRNGKLRAGPIWDLDLTFGNDLLFWGYDRSKTNLWYFEDQYYNNGSRFWYDLFYDDSYKCYLSKRFNEVIQTGQPMCPDSIDTFIDETVSEISEAVSREYERWGKSGSIEERAEDIKTFISQRISWMRVSLGSFSECDNVAVPPLVISKINYHPLPTTEYPDDDDLEFIEITNNSNETVNLSGIYFKGTGLVYGFPAGAILGSDKRVIIASNMTAFSSRWGFSPYGQFTRHLSNSAEDLVLIDAFGNLIDEVSYSDDDPWPDADGNGKYLKLTDIDLDNSLAASWTASSETITSVNVPSTAKELQIYPNPVSDILYIVTDSYISGITVFDLSGRKVIDSKSSEMSSTVDVRNLASGTYVIKVTTSAGYYYSRFIKY